MRINAINLLMKQPKEQLADSIRRLLTDKVLERRLAGLDMMKTIHNTEFLQGYLSGTSSCCQKKSKTERQGKGIDRVSDWRRNGKRQSHSTTRKRTVSDCTTLPWKSTCRKSLRTKDSM